MAAGRRTFYGQNMRKTDVSNTLFPQGNFDLLASNGWGLVAVLMNFPGNHRGVKYGRSKAGILELGQC